MNLTNETEIKTNTASDIIREPRKRQTAFKLRIADLHRGSMVANERFNFLELDGKEILRVNIIANVIDKFISEGEKRYAALTIDDASSQVRIKAFGEDTEKLRDFEIGDTILVIGTLRHFNNEIYILPEILRHLETEWLLARKLEIEKLQKIAITKEASQQNNQARISKQLRQVPLSEEQKEMVTNITFNKQSEEKIMNRVSLVEPEKVSETIRVSDEEKDTREKILELLRQKHEGIDIDEIIMSLNVPVEEINSTVTEMLEQAEIYEPKPGRIRLL